jgi:4-hydroxyphenylpyruvate dioxygenase
MKPQEQLPELNNPLGIDGIEFIEYATTQPQALGALLEQMGFVAIARHRSREVMLYRQGAMNIIVNADRRTLPHSESDPQATVIGAVAGCRLPPSCRPPQRWPRSRSRPRARPAARP